MDKEALEILAYFRENVFELKNLGKEWGLSDSEITQCIDQAMLIKAKDLPTASTEISVKLSSRKTRAKVRSLLYFIASLFLIMVIASTAALQNQTTLRRFDESLGYSVMRLVRTVAASFHDIVDMHDYFQSECVVDNPLFKAELILGDHVCENCARITSATQLNSSSLSWKLLDAAFVEPVLYKEKGHNISLETLQIMLRPHPAAWQPVHGVKSNLAWALQLKDLLDKDAAEKLNAQPDFQFQWTSTLVSTSHMLKDVFKEPVYKGHRLLQKILILLGPKAAAVQLRKLSGVVSIYSQAQGSAEVELTPAARCAKECFAFKTLLHVGDLLVFNHGVYTGTLKPLQEGSISISLLSYIM